MLVGKLGSCNNLETAGPVVLKLGNWIDYKVEIIFCLLFYLLTLKFGFPDNLNIPEL